MGAGIALLRAGVVLGGTAAAEAKTELALLLACADTGRAPTNAESDADSDRLRAIRARYLGFQSGKTFMRLFISRSSIPSSSIASYSRAASSYNLLTL